MSGYAKGHRAYGECMRCGFRVAYTQLLEDGDIPGLRVCGTCWEPHHPQDDPPPISPDRQALYKPSPELSVPDDEGTAAPALTFND